MTVAAATGYGGAQGVFDLDPEFPVVERRIRRGKITQRPEAGFHEARQTALSSGEIDLNDQVREWELNWSMAASTEAARLKQLYDEARGGGGLLLYYPPEETVESNICPSPLDFTSSVWMRETDETSVVADTGVAVPAAVVGGTSYLLKNSGSATEPASIRADVGRFPSQPTLFTFGVYVQRPAAIPSANVTLKFTNITTGPTEHYATWTWGGASWAPSATSGGASPLTSVVGAWTRIMIVLVAGSSGAPFYPARRLASIENGTAATPEAGKDVLITGAIVEEAQAGSTLASLGTYKTSRTHVRVRIMDQPLRISRWGPNQYRMSVTLREVPVAP